MNGRVIGSQARMGVVLYAPSGIGLEIECIVDTGFEGFLTLPVAVVEKLELTYLGPMNANLADNSRITTQVYQARILWKLGERVIPILAMGNRPLLGTALLEDYHLSIDFYEGGMVIVDEIL
jgi:clan AA aspartic protease